MLKQPWAALNIAITHLIQLKEYVKITAQQR